MSIWSDVDRSTNPESAVDWQETMAQWPFCRQYKARTVELLDLSEGDSVLDLGCGPGSDLPALANAVGATGKVTAIDSSRHMIARAQKSVEGIDSHFELTTGDAHRLPFPSASFDACRADRLFQHLADPLAALQELMRVTKSGGKIVVVDPDQDTLVIAVDAGPITDIIRNFRKTHPTNPTIASHIGGMFANLGAVPTQVDAHTLILRKPEDAFGLLEWPHMLLSQGKLTQEEIFTWTKELQRSIERCSFFYGVTFFITCARKL